MFVKINDYTIINLLEHKEIQSQIETKRIYFDGSSSYYVFYDSEQTKKAFDLICEALSHDRKYLDLDKHLQ